jgi:chromosome segregation ATPase
MKDKKSIAIVVLAAITAGIGIYTIVNNQSKLSAYDDLKGKHADVSQVQSTLADRLQTMTGALDALDTEAEQLKVDLGDSQQSTETLTQQKTTLEENIKDNDLKFVAQLGKKDEALKQVSDELAGKTTELKQASQALETAKTDAATTKTALDQKQKALADLKTETDATIAESKKMIVDLETKFEQATRDKGALDEQIKNLNSDIEETSEKLETSEGDRTFLERELLRMQGEKAELVRKMNNLDYISAQYKRIKAEFNVARRLDWMRRGVGIYAKKKTISEQNAELRGEVLTLAKTDPANAETIQVELTSDGRVKINGKVVEPPKKDEENTPKTGADAGNPVAPKKVSSQD